MFKVASANIRFDNPQDGRHDWAGRRILLSSLLNDFCADIFGTQEGREEQIKDLCSLLPNHTLVEEHREWIEERMYPCIFVNSQNIEVISSGDIWLSETPTIGGSKSFNSAFPRLCTWIKAKHKHRDFNFFYVNTHLDHVLSSTRSEQIQVLIDEVKRINDQNLPIIVTGDFNESPQEEVRDKLISQFSNLYDPWTKHGHLEETSYHKFDGLNPEGARIDWIIADKFFESKSIRLAKENQKGIFPSDHFPVLAEFTIS
ncbi:endonuclease/exonuclease/phosphatase family protein [Halobacteriovorax sp. HLS]|uniref:endonuclease/exonuclease/phosphatase family protein n=1 Tax=Halobacteriovorax sp. HLS TaxID=2234000 RepID=UPI000FD845E9|nr:endonuclease/exonuclease/phosphatase family protein [Halobacteriovorax sp. HLS]